MNVVQVSVSIDEFIGELFQLRLPFTLDTAFHHRMRIFEDFMCRRESWRPGMLECGFQE